MDFDRESPFQPEHPVAPDRFMGRRDTINKILRYVNTALKGETQHFFLTGKKRMGKTSVADFVSEFLDYKKHPHLSNKNVVRVLHNL